jgi:hypothetical protein
LPTTLDSFPRHSFVNTRNTY